ncbi:hypothetical protein SYNPS1DRAFT_14278 [Syncephalis pseudoplumigaleata]|uniref:Phospholipid-transporting ATPase n=1 Tax=Syncephalis pseudoplumigaleata TaxID=1712513 RepID=A0A4P9Z204_9FUNG|nr:hypothetical protein SYNPS1DRAFT_14278 [Syncephalis pseudoplumigaleata]|eukprot:RKP26375.1 hypothetical protein SYNPS1DRAFT_14278 [Syncephalis pseudoplumigaleata]
MLHRPDRQYPTNYIRTTKYTLWSFVPVNLFFQFRRFYNIYFLLAAIFVLLEPSLDPTSELLPLCIVLFITAVKDGLEDYKRYKQDKQANTKEFTVVRDGKHETVLSMDIVPGDVVYLTKDVPVPADLVLLSSSNEDGTCYIDTVELDGETSLKTRDAVQLTQGFSTPEDIMRLRGHIECEMPNERLNVFEGLITLEIDDRRADMTPLSMEQLLLRGSTLRNTEFIYGTVIYAGEDTKVFKNLKQTGLKFSTLEKRLNQLISYIFVFNAILLIVSTCLFPTQRNASYPNAWYLPPDEHRRTMSRVFGVFMVFFVLYSFVVPISVFVSVELVRVAQASFMAWDDGMRSSTGRAMKVHNSNLNEDLGAVEYIFSDKTGTLTQNVMRLAKWQVGRQVLDETTNPGALKQYYEVGSMTLVDQEEKEHVANFVRCVAICHVAIPVMDKDGTSVLYESPSPDESALLYGLREDDGLLVHRSKDTITISVFGEEETYELLRVLDFTSDRKRMSVIVRNDRGTFLFCKGADNIITQRLREDTDKKTLAATNDALLDFSVNGLRTLMMAWKKFKPGEYEAFARRYEKAECALRNRDRKVARASELAEIRLRLLGCSAIEDKLQDQVPETIQYLLQCDIRIWLLTGDKQETAVKVGKSSRLISASMNIMTLNAKSGPECAVFLDQFISEVEEADHDARNALVVDGESLVYILLLPELAKKFLQIGVRCRSVICCRVTPLQKALVVRLVKKQLHKVTLSIGDGANDVSMIQEAHVGVGIEGMEGAQAVRASDYSFVEFKALRRLLSVHGRYSYMRVANIILYSLYKSIALITVQFWFGFFNAWCGQAVYEDHFLTLWNVAYTSLPPIAMAIFDKDVDEDKIALYPRLYKAVKDGRFWNAKLELRWAFASIWHSVVVFGSFMLIIGDGTVLSNGGVLGHTAQSFLVGNFILMVVYAKLGLTVRRWVWIFAASIAISLIANLLFMYGLELFRYLAEPSIAELYSLAAHYFGIAIVVVICCLPDYVYHYYQRSIRPDDADIVQEESCRPNARAPLHNADRWQWLILLVRRVFGRQTPIPSETTSGHDSQDAV